MKIFLKRRMMLGDFKLSEIHEIEIKINNELENKTEKYIDGKKFDLFLKQLNLSVDQMLAVKESIFIERKWIALRDGWSPLSEVIEKYEIHKGNNHRYLNDYEGPKEFIVTRWFVKEADYVRHLRDHFKIID